MIPNGKWFVKLKDGRKFAFYYGTSDQNPLEKYPDFSVGDAWEMDIDGDHEFERGVEFPLVPKALVENVYFEPFSDHTRPVKVNSMTANELFQSLGTERPRYGR